MEVAWFSFPNSWPFWIALLSMWIQNNQPNHLLRPFILCACLFALFPLNKHFVEIFVGGGVYLWMFSGGPLAAWQCREATAASIAAWLEPSWVVGTASLPYLDPGFKDCYRSRNSGSMNEQTVCSILWDCLDFMKQGSVPFRQHGCFLYALLCKLHLW